MDAETRHKIIWGWLRLFPAVLQLALAPLAVGAWLVVGLGRLTWLLVIGATTATVTSRLIYHGKKDPRLESAETHK